MEKTELVIYQMGGRNDIKGVMNPTMKLSQYKIEGEDIYAAEILARPGRDIIKKFYMD